MKQTTLAAPRGFEIWRGPSPFDGSPIVAIAVLRSDNAKTGDMIQVYILRRDMTPVKAMQQGHEGGTCGDCSLRHKPSGGHGLCYVNRLYTDRVYQFWNMGNYTPLKQSDLRYFRNRSVRLGAFGDPAMIPLEVMLPILKVARGHSGYTHMWMHDFAQPWKQYVMASVESPALQQAAKATGWRCFRIRRHDEPLLAGERVCPASAEAGTKVQCEQCLACHGARTAGRADLAIIVHGSAYVPPKFVKLSTAGKFEHIPQAV